MLKTVNLKTTRPDLQTALAIIQTEIQNAKAEDVSVLKVLHGYGSHGKGGIILIELRKYLLFLKKKGQIKDFFGGDDWNLFNQKTLQALKADKSIALDCDLNKSNPGITIIVLN